MPARLMWIYFSFQISLYNRSYIVRLRKAHTVIMQLREKGELVAERKRDQYKLCAFWLCNRTDLILKMILTLCGFISGVSS